TRTIDLEGLGLNDGLGYTVQIFGPRPLPRKTSLPLAQIPLPSKISHVGASAARKRRAATRGLGERVRCGKQAWDRWWDEGGREREVETDRTVWGRRYGFG